MFPWLERAHISHMHFTSLDRVRSRRFAPSPGIFPRHALRYLVPEFSDSVISESENPEIVEYFNKTKGGVDTFDQMWKQYSCCRKTESWSLCPFYCILNAAVINSWIIHKDNMDRDGKPTLKRKDYTEKFGMQLIKPHAVTRLNAPDAAPASEWGDNTCGINPSVKVRGTGPTVRDSREPMVRCSKCPSKADKKTRFRCHNCHQPVCPHHYYAFSGTCLWCVGKL